MKKFQVVINGQMTFTTIATLAHTAVYNVVKHYEHLHKFSKLLIEVRDLGKIKKITCPKCQHKYYNYSVDCNCRSCGFNQNTARQEEEE